MQNVIIVIHLIVVLALVGVVLLQRSEGGALGMGGGGVSGFMTGRGQANALTRATAVLAGIFFLTSLILAVLASGNRGPASIVPGAPAAVPAAPGAPAAPAGPGGVGVFDQLQRLQQPAAPPAPGAPPAPAPAQ